MIADGAVIGLEFFDCGELGGGGVKLALQPRAVLAALGGWAEISCRDITEAGRGRDDEGQRDQPAIHGT